MADATNSAQGAPPPGNATAQVCGEFHDKDKLNEAMSRLEGSDFQRADLSLGVPGEGHQDNLLREDDTRTLRTLGTSMAATVAALAAAGVVVATGGVALAAMAAAAAAGGATAVAGEAVAGAAAPQGETVAQRAAGQVAGVVLMVHAASPEKRAKAAMTLQACGATRVWHQGGV